MKFEARVAVWSHVVFSERKLGQMIQRSTPERRFKGCRHSNTQQIELIRLLGKLGDKTV